MINDSRFKWLEFISVLEFAHTALTSVCLSNVNLLVMLLKSVLCVKTRVCLCGRGC